MIWSFRFDAPRLPQLATSLNLLTELIVFVKGFCDTLLVFKSVLLERKRKKLTFNQSALAHEYLNEEDIKVAHNALNDVLILQKLVDKLCNKTSIIQHTRSIDFILNSKKRAQETNKLRMTVTNVIAKAGINRSILENAYATGGLDSLTILLSENVNRKSRVTKN